MKELATYDTGFEHRRIKALREIAIEELRRVELRKVLFEVKWREETQRVTTSICVHVRMVSDNDQWDGETWNSHASHYEWRGGETEIEALCRKAARNAETSTIEKLTKEYGPEFPAEETT